MASDFGFIRKDFKEVREKVLRSCRNNIGAALMEDTQARIFVEIKETRARHDKLWKESGETIESPFEPFPVLTELAEQECKEWRRKLLDWSKKKKSSIADVVIADAEERGASYHLEQMEVGPGIEHYRMAESAENEHAFANKYFAMKLLENVYGEKSLAKLSETNRRSTACLQKGLNLRCGCRGTIAIFQTKPRRRFGSKC